VSIANKKIILWSVCDFFMGIVIVPGTCTYTRNSVMGPDRESLVLISP
jgi:hypothetical protein